MESRDMFLGGIEYIKIDENRVIPQYFSDCINEANELATRDHLDMENNIIQKRVGKTILTGDEKWFFDEKTKSYYYFQFNKFYKNITGKYDKMLCTHFRWTRYKENLEYGEFQGGEKNQIMFNFDYGEKGVDNFKRWLRGKYEENKPVEVYYIMQYPEIIKRDEPYVPNPRFIPSSLMSVDAGEVQPIVSEKYSQYYNQEKNFINEI